MKSKEEVFEKLNIVPSKTQVELCDFLQHGIGNAVVESRAGSGKSKTIEMLAHLIPDNKKALIICFNKHIAQHLQPKFKDSKAIIKVMTYHSFGFRVLSTKYKITPEGLDDNKYHSYVFDNVSSLSITYKSLNGIQKHTFRNNVLNLIDYSRYNMCQSVKEIKKVADKYGVFICGDECDVVRKCLKWGAENIITYDYQDLIWLPFELGINANLPNLQFDYVFVDEAQDSSLAQQELLKIAKKRMTRTFVFGDSFQCINSWCGSDEDAFEKFNEMDNVKQFTLNISYRCPKKVGEIAKQYVPDFECSDNAIEGEINYGVPIDKINVGSMVLCRTTAPLVDLHVHLLHLGLPSKIRGLSIGSDLIEKMSDFKDNDTVTDIRNKMVEGLLSLWHSVAEKNGITLKSAVTDNEVMAYYDTMMAFNIISKGAKDKKDIVKNIQEIIVSNETNITDENDGEYVNLTTIHRAKGLENDNVYILCPSLLPSKLAKKDWEVKAETNLIYVAYTRAKKTLNFLEEKEIKPSRTLSSPDVLFDTMQKLQNSIETLKFSK